MYANTCSNVDVPVSDFGIGSVRYCPAGMAGTCECSGTANVDVGVSATSNSGSVAPGGTVTYTATVTNHDATTAASGVTLSLEPSAGMQINGASFTSTLGSCDASVNVCTLGNLPAGQSATVTVTATLPTAGAWPVTFSVTHRDADSVVWNDGAVVTQIVQ
jgi:uncharacterized repeat protein (TIGR01451 family)